MGKKKKERKKEVEYEWQGIRRTPTAFFPVIFRILASLPYSIKPQQVKQRNVQGEEREFTNEKGGNINCTSPVYSLGLGLHSVAHSIMQDQLGKFNREREREVSKCMAEDRQPLRVCRWER